MDFLVKTIKGFIIGLASMTAGASVFAIALGIYDKCMEIIANPFKNFKKNLKYIFPIVLGILISVILFGKLIVYLLNNYEAYVKFAFLGIVLGGIPTLIKKANKNGYNKKYLIPLGIAFIITILITILTNSFSETASVTARMNPLLLIAYGAIFAFGAVMPAMTTIPILMYLGVFTPIMDGIFAINFSIIIPFEIGYLLIVLLTAQLITYLFKKFYGYTYYGIIGFSITSLGMLIPKLTGIEYVICPILAIAIAFGVYKITKLEKN